MAPRSSGGSSDQSTVAVLDIRCELVVVGVIWVGTISVMVLK